jgi:carbonic anhydrase
MKKTFLSALLVAALLSGCSEVTIIDSPAGFSKIQNQTLANFEARHARLGIGKGAPADLLSEAGDTPIDIPTQRTRKFISSDPVFHYTRFALSEVRHTGENLKVVVPGTNYLTIRSKRYDLAQFHFHRGSEHSLSGRFGAMEVHLVHLSQEGDIAVVGALLQPGRENAAMGTLLEVAPESEGSVSSARLFHAGQLLPNPATPYYMYSGSLTTAPFTTGLTWIVYKLPVTISREQLHRYEHLFKEENVREQFPVGNRVVYECTGSVR